MELKIVPYQDKHREQILNVWERSVLATHDFLIPTDFEEIKELVATIDFNELDVFCLLDKEKVLGFIGVADQKVEMLFLDPDYLGKGLGKQFLDFAIEELHANLVDVNEQNTKAVNFYKKFGFETFERSEKDDQGRNYPILRMKLAIN